ncbi:hypothetical protein WJX79_003119 [Trebouxia sp. C0005]
MVLEAFSRADATERKAQVEEVMGALLRRTQDAGGVRPRRKDKIPHGCLQRSYAAPIVTPLLCHCDSALAAAWHHAPPMLALVPNPQAKLSLATLMLLPFAPCGCQVWCVTSLMEVTLAEVRWAIPWQGKPGQQEEEPLAHELRCWPKVAQADQIHLIALKEQRQYYNEPSKDSQRPVTKWKPLPPQSYRASGIVVVSDAEQPGSKEVLCVREDICAKTGIYDSPIWKFEPPILQVCASAMEVVHAYLL